jgi:hypothetical protein
MKKKLVLENPYHLIKGMLCEAPLQLDLGNSESWEAVL